ncbi:MAG: ROK family protein, partial [bacterium]|nr:ROK family protein [bacterium]
MERIKVTLGVDVGGTNTVFGLVGREGSIYLKDYIPTGTDKIAELFFERLFAGYRAMISGHEDGYELVGIGIGAPNANYYRGTVEEPPNLDWGTVNVADIIKRHFSLPVVVTNDANAAALGEWMFGAARGMKDFVVITLGTGLGSGIVVNGEVVYGHDGMAGEIGHVNVKRDGRLCACGKKGCLEAYVSATGLVNTTLELLESSGQDQSDPLKAIPPDQLTSKRVYDEALKGNKTALTAFEITNRVLGEALANTVAHLSPEAV